MPFPKTRRCVLLPRPCLFAVLIFGALSLAACDELPQTPTEQPQQVTRFQSNSQLRSSLNSIQQTCKAQYSSNKEGAAVANALFGGGLIGGIAADAAKASYQSCMKRYERVAATGRAQGYTADPRAEAAAAAEKRRRQQAQAWAQALSQMGQASPSTSSTSCDGWCQDQKRRAEQDALAENLHHSQ